MQIRGQQWETFQLASYVTIMKHGSQRMSSLYRQGDLTDRGPDEKDLGIISKMGATSQRKQIVN